MAKTVTAPKSKLEKARVAAKGIAAQADEINLAAEALLFQYEENEVIRPEDINVLRLAGFGERETLDSERSRIARVKRFLQAAGTQEDYTKAKQNLDTTSKELSTLGAQLKEQIAVMQQQIAKLKADEKAASLVVHSYEQARERLSEPRVLPMFAREMHAQAVMLAQDGIKLQIVQMKSRLKTISAVLGLASSSSEALSHARNNAKELIITNAHGQEAILHSMWADYREQLIEERIELTEELELLQRQLQERLAESRRIAHFYLDQIPAK